MERAIEHFKFYSFIWTALAVIALLLELQHDGLLIRVSFNSSLIIAVIYRVAAGILRALDSTRDGA